MPPFGTLRKALSKQLGEESQILKDLDACVHELKCAASEREKIITRTVQVRDTSADAEIKLLCKKVLDLEETLTIERRESDNRVQDGRDRIDNLLKSTLFSVVDANLYFPEVVDLLLQYPPIADGLKKRGPRMLVARNFSKAPLANAEHRMPFSEAASDLVFCDDPKTFQDVLNTSTGWLMIFACGYGYVAELCISTSAEMSRVDFAEMSRVDFAELTCAAANQLLGRVEFLNAVKAVRVSEGGQRIWKYTIVDSLTGEVIDQNGHTPG